MAKWNKVTNWYDGRKQIKELDIQFKESMVRLLGGKNGKSKMGN